MKKSHWNDEEWLARCAWCSKFIDPDCKIMGLNARLDPKIAHQFPPNTIRPLTLPNSGKTVPLISPGVDSEARRGGVDAVFRICSHKCGHQLRAALRQGNSVTGIQFSHPSQAAPPPLPPPPPLSLAQSRHSMEKMMRNITRLLQEQNFESAEEADAFMNSLMLSQGGAPDFLAASESPLDQAQDILAEAWGNPSRKQRVSLARQALELSPDCADAYLLLAQEEKTPQAKKELYEQAVQAAERALGPESFREFAGHFWGVTETRPYMRARASLAQCLWNLGERATAIEHYRALLELNPGDNQGNRYVLLGWLLAEGDDEEAGKLLKCYPDEATAAWAYDRALWLFRKEGPSRPALKLLRGALKENRLVPAYLLGEKKLPASGPDSIMIGGEDEAVDYALRAASNWKKIPYALDWLRENSGTQG